MVPLPSSEKVKSTFQGTSGPELPLYSAFEYPFSDFREPAPRTEHRYPSRMPLHQMQKQK